MVRNGIILFFKERKSSVIPFMEGSGYFMLIGGYKQSEGKKALKLGQTLATTPH